MKTLALHACEWRHRHLSHEELMAANAQASMLYRGKTVDKVFTPSLRPAIETMTAMMVGNTAFAEAEHHSAIEGLGHEQVLPLLYNEQFCDYIEAGVAVMDALRWAHDHDVQDVFKQEAVSAVGQMLARLQDDQLGVGTFLGHFVVIAANVCRLQIHSLQNLEAVVFEFHGDEEIVAKCMPIS